MALEDVGISLLEEELLQLSVKGSLVSPTDKPSLMCFVWTKKSCNPKFSGLNEEYLEDEEEI